MRPRVASQILKHNLRNGAFVWTVGDTILGIWSIYLVGNADNGKDS